MPSKINATTQSVKLTADVLEIIMYRQAQPHCSNVSMSVLVPGAAQTFAPLASADATKQYYHNITLRKSPNCSVMSTSNPTQHKHEQTRLPTSLNYLLRPLAACCCIPYTFHHNRFHRYRCCRRRYRHQHVNRFKICRGICLLHTVTRPTQQSNSP